MHLHWTRRRCAATVVNAAAATTAAAAACGCTLSRIGSQSGSQRGAAQWCGPYGTPAKGRASVETHTAGTIDVNSL
jgi:hypothetical protein